MENYGVWSFFVIKTSHTQGAILKLVQDNTLQIILQNNNSKDAIEKKKLNAKDKMCLTTSRVIIQIYS